MRQKLLVVIFSLFVLLITACSADSAGESEPVGDPERGRKVFEDTKRVRCTACHRLDDKKFFGPSLLGISERAGDRAPDVSAVEYLQQSLLEPSVYLVEGYDHREMKTYKVVDPDEVDFLMFGMLTQEEFNDLIAFLLTQ